jgi:regulator of protease activity HflC (stomatin/prohibitin superfamily)
MKSVIYILYGLIIALLIAALFEPFLFWAAVPLLGFALAYTLTRACIYRPPEDHLGVVYQLGRLWRLVEPNRLIFVLPGVRTVKDAISLHVRQVTVCLPDLLTQDQVPIDCELIVFYQLDPRLAVTDFQAQALRISEGGWNSAIKTVLQETAGEVIGGIPFQQLLKPSGRHRLKRALGALLAERLQRFGVVVDQRTGVSLQALKPADVIWQAMQERLAAVSLGEAALARVLPMVQELSQQHPDIGWEALLLEWAAVIAKEGAVPQVLVGPDQGAALADWGGKSWREPTRQASTDETAPRHNGRPEAELVGQI